MNVITDLNTGIVIDRPGLNKLPTAELNAVLTEQYTKGKPVVLVDNARKYFSDDNLLRAMHDNDVDSLTKIFEYRGLTFDFATATTISSFFDLKNMIMAQLNAKPSTGRYPFAESPDGYNIEDHIKRVGCKNTASISRRNDTYYYTLRLKTLERLWLKASPIWAGTENNGSTMKVSAAGYQRTAKITDDRVKIGCQAIKRYELEALAVVEGWAFP
jgi:hypothetical protein